MDESGTAATRERGRRSTFRRRGAGQQWSLDLVYDRVEHDRQVVLRGTSFKDGIKVFNSSMVAGYRVLLVGWVLPS